MALSGSFSGSIVSGHYKLRVDWSATQNAASNTSKITAVMYLVNDWKLIISGRSDNSINIAGAAHTWASPAINGTGTTKLGTVTSGNITHDADGGKSVTISATYNIRATINGTYYEKITASATVDLTPLSKATTPTFHTSALDMGDTLTIYTYSSSDKFTHDLAYSFAGSDWVTIANDVKTWHAWFIPDLTASLTDAASGTMTIRCITKDGSGKTIGTKTGLVTVKVPADVVPSIDSIQLAEGTPELASEVFALITGKSKVKATIYASGAKDSTIKSYSTTLAGKTYTGQSWTSDVINTWPLKMVTTVTDSRGRTDQRTTSLNVCAYSPPKIYAFSASRYNAEGNPDPSGDRVALRYNYEVPDLGESTTAEMLIEYKKTTETKWQTLMTGTELTEDTTIMLEPSTLSSDYQFDMRMTVTDYFDESSQYEAFLPSAEVILDIKADGKGVAFGKTADKIGVDFGWSAKGAVLGLRGAIPIPNNDDLNDYLTPGVYSFDNSNGKLANCPLETKGTVRVWSAAGAEEYEGPNTYLIQEVVPYMNNLPTYRRAVYSTTTDDRTFDSWKVTTLNGQQVLWSGGLFMASDHSITLPPVSNLSTGIVLVFSRYSNGVLESSFHEFFVSKHAVTTGRSANGVSFTMATSDFGVVCNKLLFINNVKISGYVNNTKAGTGASGIKYDNSGFVLRYVLGV